MPDTMSIVKWRVNSVNDQKMMIFIPIIIIIIMLRIIIFNRVFNMMLQKTLFLIGFGDSNTLIRSDCTRPKALTHGTPASP